MSQTDYNSFLDRKTHLGGSFGFDPIWMPDFLFDFQKHLIEWSLRRGRAAIFADCGLGKTAMQLVWADNVFRKTRKPVLALTPLAVANQTKREAQKFGIDAEVSRDGKIGCGVVISNYDMLHHFDANSFSGLVCDESSILKSVTGATRKRIDRFISKLPYRLLCTATAAPNDWIELGTSSEALGELSNSEMLHRFFRQLDDKGQKREEKLQEAAERLVEQDPQYFGKLAFRIAQTIGQWRLKNHAVTHFWKWVASWSRACRMPSDLGFNDGDFRLPALNERDHIIKPAAPPEGMLFCAPAVGLGEEREERKRTLKDRCSYAAELVDHSRSAVIWCQMNAEGDMLEEMIPGAIQVAGKHSDEYKIAAAEWFCGRKCVCNDPMFASKLATWQKQRDRSGTGRITIRRIVNSALRNPSNTGAFTVTKSGNIWQFTINATRENSSSLPNRDPSGIEETGNVTLRTNCTGNPKKTRRKATESDALKPGLLEQCENTDQASKNTTDSSSWDALSAVEQTAVIDAITDSILTTTIKPENSGGYFALAAILDSESLATIQTVLKERQCICGHADGNRKLISKSKIFGFGLNFQHCAHIVSFVTHSYESEYQLVRRCWRFGQREAVQHDRIATEGEVRVLANVRRKADQASKMFSALIREMNGAMKVERPNIFTKQQEVPGWLLNSALPSDSPHTMATA